MVTPGYRNMEVGILYIDGRHEISLLQGSHRGTEGLHPKPSKEEKTVELFEVQNGPHRTSLLGNYKEVRVEPLEPFL